MQSPSYITSFSLQQQFRNYPGNYYCHLGVPCPLSLHLSPLRTKSCSASLRKESWTQAVLTAWGKQALVEGKFFLELWVSFFSFHEGMEEWCQGTLDPALQALWISQEVQPKLHNFPQMLPLPNSASQVICLQYLCLPSPHLPLNQS